MVTCAGGLSCAKPAGANRARNAIANRRKSRDMMASSGWSWRETSGPAGLFHPDRPGKRDEPCGALARSRPRRPDLQVVALFVVQHGIEPLGLFFRLHTHSRHGVAHLEDDPGD